MKYFLIVLAVFLCFSCKTDDALEGSSIRAVESQLLEEQVFKANSYWVYENEEGDRDSVSVTSVEYGVTNTCPGSCSIHDYITMNFLNHDQSFPYNYYLTSNLIKYNGGGSWGQVGQPYFLVNKEEGYSFNGVSVGEKLDSLEVSGTWFYDVKAMTVIASEQFQIEFDFDIETFWAPKVGVVKKVEHQDPPVTWVLTSYEVIQ